MKRQTRTELDKIVMIGMGRIDQIVNKLCDDCVTPSIEVKRTRIKSGRNPGWLRQEAERRERAAGMQNAYNPFDAQRAAGAANVGCFSALPDIGMGRFI
jgi:hypothetical protein